MKAAVLGATGFIGGYLLKSLIREGWQVVAVGRNVENVSPSLRGASNIKWIGVDVFKDDVNVEDDVDVIFHLSSLLPGKEKDRFDFYRTELKFAEVISNIKSDILVYVSSCSVCGRVGKISHNSKYDIRTDYAAAKLLGENLALLDKEKKSIVVRLPIVVGKGGRSIVNWMYDTLKGGGKVELFSYGERRRNFIYAGDVADILVALACSDKIKHRDIFVVGASDSVKLKDVAEKIRDFLGERGEIIYSEKSSPTDVDIEIDVSKVSSVINKRLPLSIDAIDKFLEEMGGKACEV